MADWRDRIYKKLTATGYRLFLVADPDRMMVEESVLQWLDRHQFVLMTFEDPVDFRYQFETRIRLQDTGLTVVRTESDSVSNLPYDLLKEGQRLSFSLGELLPNLSPRIVGGLARSELDSLYQAYRSFKPQRLGETATKDFILRHVYKIAPDLIDQPADLLHMLLLRHYGQRMFTDIIDERLIHVLQQKPAFSDWPLERIVPDPTDFWAFLQERWPAYLNDRTGQVSEQPAAYQYSGPKILPFGHDEVRVFVDNLFGENLLQPIDHPAAELSHEKWIKAGVSSVSQNKERPLRSALDALAVPANDCMYQDWFRFAYRWADCVVLAKDMTLSKQDDLSQRMRAARNHIDAAFTEWVLNRFGGLSNQPPDPPVMVHHIPQMLSRRLDEGLTEKVALVVLDGLALDQWIVLKEELRRQNTPLQYDEGAAFAWIPTITSVSRQAIFSGRLPYYFPGTIEKTDHDAKHWETYWQNQNIPVNAVAYLRGLGGNDIDQIEEIVTAPVNRVIGLVVDKVDKIMHGMELGTAGMHNQVRQWTEDGYMKKLLNLLVDHGYYVILTSDHGNVEATGCEKPSEGAVAVLRGARARIYRSDINRQTVKDQFPDAISWPSYGLPNDYLPLLAADRAAFVHSGKRIVTHGGATVEETIVPVIGVERSRA